MLKQPGSILNIEEEYKQIESVKEWIQEIHESGTFFNLSLKTLELIRRFNNLYEEVIENSDPNPSSVNQLIITSKGLESELVQVN
ncbi:hypothetical protein C8P64_1512 [Christiangramia gaetbulicola]|uniref:Uncharacterized protein n=1 Tax=Christiangramia gaetbulicola TaxID=703340 RepID=A0A2T6AGM9_9FLAO|nr:hypothetical protein [Christiangramia gaetbulicola]PTX42988.1 hypothetical protein C8P64_1512 [Christiangramia gaetbulicola]